LCFALSSGVLETDITAKGAEAAKGYSNVSPDLRGPRVDAKMELPRTWILEGTKPGSLTKGEATKTCHNLERLERLEDTYKRSRVIVSAFERHQLNQLNQLNQQANSFLASLWKKTPQRTRSHPSL